MLYEVPNILVHSGMPSVYNTSLGVFLSACVFFEVAYCVLYPLDYRFKRCCWVEVSTPFID